MFFNIPYIRIFTFKGLIVRASLVELKQFELHFNFL